MKDFYNLAFGDKNLQTGDIDDKAISNNGDSERVLSTVVSSVYSFLDNHQDAWVYATGSTKARARLHRMGLTKYIDEVKEDFYVFGLLDGEWRKFEKDEE